ncbi:hypothetical protein TCAL_13738 [Tigriopus californicus]|uniref:Integrase catalytic domain-containing protein n=1 Tax=Tigriopus californicus TaxID=6832 RepID=A0A553NU73_TIGCA|nr:hypothetical protein TCAL_13738 [Tigriopus californicus]
MYYKTEEAYGTCEMLDDPVNATDWDDRRSALEKDLESSTEAMTKAMSQAIPAHPSQAVAQPPSHRSRRVPINTTVQPPVLTLDNTPIELRAWIQKLDSFLSSNDLANTNIKEQQQYVRQLIDPELEVRISLKVDPNTPVFGPGSMIELLKDEFALRYPLFTRRLECFRYTRHQGQPALNFVAKLTQLSFEADLPSLSTDELQNASCKKCGKDGHFSIVCLADYNAHKNQKKWNKKLPRSSSPGYSTSSETDNRVSTVRFIKATKSGPTPKLSVQFMNNYGRQFIFETLPDTGASRTIIADDVAHEYGMEYSKTKEVMRAANGQPMSCIDTALLTAQIGKKTANINAIISRDLKGEILLNPSHQVLYDAIDEEYRALLHAFRRHADLHSLPPSHPAHSFASIWEGISQLDQEDESLLLLGDRIIVPAGARQEIIRILHLPHQGLTKTKPAAQPLHQIQVGGLMEMVSADLFDWAGQSWLVLVDSYSGYLIASRLFSINTDSVVTEMEKLFGLFGYPTRLCSDNGHQFRGKMTEYLTRKGVKRETSSPYFPSSNGLAEAGVKSIKALLKKCTESKEDFHVGLRELRAMPREDGYSPNQLFLDVICKEQSLDSQLQSICVLGAGWREKNFGTGSKNNPNLEHVPCQSWNLEQTSRSYVISDGEKTFRRNRKFIRPQNPPIRLGENIAVEDLQCPAPEKSNRLSPRLSKKKSVSFHI